MKIKPEPIKKSLIVDVAKKEKQLNNQYNKIGFICQSLIPIIDDLIETTSPKFALKKACKDLLREAEIMTSEHYKPFTEFGKVGNESIESLDIYHVTSLAYDEAVKFFIERSPNEVVSIMELIRRAEKDGVKLNEIAVEYKPLEI